ncbi:ATP-binding protein [Bradyrhizobium sp.]|uniref:ATP-binding protein n=1 Tax=Bradyrhizobium sp. TaxID=376 RepID=UPI003BAEAC0B
MSEGVEHRAADPLQFLSGGGELGALMRGRDWSSTPFGTPFNWPQSLRSAASIMLNSRYPIALYWGPELALIYNDAWSPIPGGKHPWALGRPAREVWPEIWETIGPLFDKVMTSAEGVWQEDELLPMNRRGYLEECYFNFTFSPVRGEGGEIDGIFNAVVETTDRVLSERRLRTMSRMGERPDPTLSIAGVCRWAAGILSENAADVPFALIYLRDGRMARLAACVSTEAGSAAAPTEIDLDSGSREPWPLVDAADAVNAIVIRTPDEVALTSAFWAEPITEAVIVPIATAADESPSAFLVAGANSRRRVDATYRSFFELAAGHIASAIATARSYEDERRRAEALAEIDRAKTTFFSNVSHEFRTPLTLMIGPIEDALAEAADPDQRARLEVAHRNALRLLRLVNSLLDFSRIEAGRVDATFRPTDLTALTADLASSFRSATDKAGLELKVDVQALSEPAYVDGDMWEKIVLNLLSNAFKFTHQGGIAVDLRQMDSKITLTVRDTGVGIPAAALPKLFERFHRVEGVHGRSFEGTGIGLALVQELVSLHGGEVTVESAEGKGSTFTVSIPLGAAHLPSERVEATTANEVTTASRTQAFVEEAKRWINLGDGADGFFDAGSVPLLNVAEGVGTAGCILLADDNADLRNYICRLLSERGYQVEVVADGEAALAALRKRRPDLLIADVMMPRLDGIGLLRALRQDQDLRELPVILLSARSGEEAKVEGLDAGADDYLTKPFSGRELLARVSANIKLAGLRREATAAIRESEERLRELNATLERRVVEALAEKRLFADIVEATDAPVQAIDNDFRFLAINAAAQADYERLFGVRPVAGQSLLEILAPLPAESEGAQQVWGRALAGESFTESSWWGDDARERRAYEMQFRPLLDDHGRRIGAYLFGRDVTDRIREQERLAAAEEQLRQAQKMEAMGQLTGGVAHDFNNLLTPIVGALDLLQRKNLGGEREQRLISNAQQSAERAKTLVQRLLAFARRQPLQAMAVDVAGIIAGMADLIESTTGPQIRVSVDVAEGLPSAMADPNQLEMALLNLAVNARDAMPSGGTLRITSSAEQVGPGHRTRLNAGRYILLSVADTGSGMDEATLARAVEPFFSTKGVGKGTGLGLSMVHGLASQLGGALTIQSRLGLGTNIELWLPVNSGPLANNLPQKGPETKSGTGTALLVDDEELVRASTADMLTELGFAVVEAPSAEEALRLIRNGLSPDLLVTDHLMPGMNGTDLARIARSERPGVQVLLVSGYAEADGVAPDLQRLIKPFRSEDLARSLAEIRRSKPH